MNYLEQFNKQPETTKKYEKVNTDLMAIYEFHAKYHGDKYIKVQIANNRRTVTALKSCVEDFKATLENKTSFVLTIKALGLLTNDLLLLAKWAREYKAFYENARKSELNELDVFCENRWGGDSNKFTFEYDIINELATKQGLMKFANWVHSGGNHGDVKPENIHCCVEGLSGIVKYGNIGNGTDMHNVAMTLKVLVHKQFLKDKRVKNGSNIVEKHVSFDLHNYEEYLEYRRNLV